MVEAGSGGVRHRRKDQGLPRPWCCSFGVEPLSPEKRGGPATRRNQQRHQRRPKQSKGAYAASLQSSSSPSSSKMGLGLIDPRRILSPGRVSPIDSDAPLSAPPEAGDSACIARGNVESEPEYVDPVPKEKAPVLARLSSASSAAEVGVSQLRGKDRSMDLRLSLKGKDGKCLVLELDSAVLCHDSTFFAAMVSDARRKASDAAAECRKLEVAEIENLSVFRDTIQLMYVKDIMKYLVKVGVHRTIDILEVSSAIMFNRGVISCLKFLDAVPWSENEEEKLKGLFARCSFDEAIAQNVLERLYTGVCSSSQDLALRLVQSVMNGTNSKARKELQTLVNCLFSKSSVYQKKPAGLSREGLYRFCNSCLGTLIEMFEEASECAPSDGTGKARESRPMIEVVSRQVDNLIWILEILLNNQMAEDFVGLWAKQDDLVRLHAAASPMVRYELSRISASVFMALGRGKLQCRGDLRYEVLSTWFRPMMSDFGWLHRCSKGLDVRMLEEDMGQAILTLSLPQQQALFVEWFRRFSEQGSECPNLSKAFQIWWRRSFARTADVRGPSVDV